MLSSGAMMFFPQAGHGKFSPISESGISNCSPQ
jgi:hypothetical protein